MATAATCLSSATDAFAAAGVAVAAADWAGARQSYAEGMAYLAGVPAESEAGGAAVRIRQQAADLLAAIDAAERSANAAARHSRFMTARTGFNR